MSEKIRKPRKRKELPLFKQWETTGEIKEMRKYTANGTRADKYTINDIQMGIHSKFIPLYCAFDSGYLSNVNDVKMSIISNVSNRKSNIALVEDRINVTLSNEMSFSFKRSMMYNGSHVYRGNVSSLPHVFNNNVNYTHFRISEKKGWRLFLDPLHMMIDKFNSVDIRLCVFPVILPENLEYHRLRWINCLPVDLSKVILLVDRDIESPQYPVKGARTFFNREILPYILKTSCTVFSVPQDFIWEYCFYKEYKFKEKGIIKQMKELEDIKQGFINQYGERKREEQTAILEEAKEPNFPF